MIGIDPATGGLPQFAGSSSATSGGPLSASFGKSFNFGDQGFSTTQVLIIAGAVVASVWLMNK